MPCKSTIHAVAKSEETFRLWVVKDHRRRRSCINYKGMQSVLRRFIMRLWRRLKMPKTKTLMFQTRRAARARELWARWRPFSLPTSFCHNGISHQIQCAKMESKLCRLTSSQSVSWCKAAVIESYSRRICPPMAASVLPWGQLRLSKSNRWRPRSSICWSSRVKPFHHTTCGCSRRTFRSAVEPYRLFRASRAWYSKWRS